ncbi:MAG TPA: response regulator transcription factor [Dehalococcoidia bacterium]|nr:response regulator transcription factor [Dehalococcoidia bacterium]
MAHRDRVLVVEDEPMVAEVVDRYLRHEGFDTMVVHDGPSALTELERFMPDLVVLDLMLPGLDGFEVCRRVRSAGETPVIILTARAREDDKLLGLGLGADDYVTKPFSPRELVARVKVVLRRARAVTVPDGERLRFGDLRINERTRVVEDARGEIRLTAREFDLLVFLARHAGQVFTRDQLMDFVWDFDFAGDASTVTVHIRRLRSKVEVDPSRPRHIKTVWGVGYKFEP